jgi:hypothetical protein
MIEIKSEKFKSDLLDKAVKETSLNKSSFSIEKNKFGYLTAITLPLLLAACGGGGGGGGGALSDTPSNGGSTDSGSTDSGSTDSGSGSGSSSAGIQANAGRIAATSDADTFLYDVSFASDGSVTSVSDGNVFISDFDPANDTIALRGTGAPSSFTSGGSSNVDIVSTIDGDTTISLGSDNDATGTITLTGVSDASLVTVTTLDEAADAGSPKVDLSSGSVASTSAGEIFEYSVKFENGVPVAIDGAVTITGFDVAIDKLVLKTESLPSGYGKTNLLSTTGVDVTTGIDETRIDFGKDISGNSGSIIIDGLSDKDLATIDLVFEISSPSISGNRVDIDASTATASADAETFVYDASWDGDEVVGSDGNVTISGFNLTSDKIIILGASIPSGYDRSQFEANSAGTQQIVVDAINNQTVIYFAPDSDGSSSTLTLDGIADEDNNLNIVFGASIGDEPAPAPAAPAEETPAAETPAEETPAEETPAEETPAEETPAEETPAEETPAEETPAEETPAASYTIVNIPTATEDSTVTATSAAEEFRFEVTDAGVSGEGAYTVTIDGFDATNDKLTLVIVNGTSNLTTAEFDQLTNVAVTSDGISGTQIFFAPDGDNNSGTLVLPNVEESFEGDWLATTYTVEIIADSNLIG